MILRACANLSSVKNFEMSASAVRDYSERFDRGVECLSDLFDQLAELAESLRASVATMATTRENLDAKIHNIEEILARLTEKLNRLEKTLSQLEDELSTLYPMITVRDDNGDYYEVENPEYLEVCDRIDHVEMTINTVTSEMHTYQERLDRANDVSNRLESHTDAVSGAIHSLEEKKHVCQLLLSELTEIKRQNLRQGSAAVDALKRIGNLIKDYLQIKMKYDTAESLGQTVSGDQRRININVNINRTTIVKDPPTNRQPGRTGARPSAEEIEKHRISFDAEGRISSYDGKSFGGKYNTYDERLSHAFADDNPIFGHYEGLRGESKFIPSMRTAEGVVVTGILQECGVDGIYYRNAEPDFEPCAYAVVKIAFMTENRDNYLDSNGENTLGNFSQADIELAKAWNLGNKDGRNDWKPRDVTDYRKANNLTWHEKCDTETMVLVRSEINSFFRHSGGCSECRVRDSAGTDRGGFDE